MPFFENDRCYQEVHTTSHNEENTFTKGKYVPLSGVGLTVLICVLNPGDTYGQSVEVYPGGSDLSATHTKNADKALYGISRGPRTS